MSVDRLLEGRTIRKAIADFTALIALEPDEPEAYDLRARAYARTRQYTRAIADCNSSLRLRPSFTVYL